MTQIRLFVYLVLSVYLLCLGAAFGLWRAMAASFSLCGVALGPLFVAGLLLGFFIVSSLWCWRARAHCARAVPGDVVPTLASFCRLVHCPRV